MQIKLITIGRDSINKTSYLNQEFNYKDAVINNKRNPTSDNIITNLSLVLLDMFLEIQSEHPEQEVES